MPKKRCVRVLVLWVVWGVVLEAVLGVVWWVVLGVGVIWVRMSCDPFGRSDWRVSSVFFSAQRPSRIQFDDHLDARVRSMPPLKQIPSRIQVR